MTLSDPHRTPREIIARAVKDADGSNCISTYRRGGMCRYPDGCICLSHADAIIAAFVGEGIEMVERKVFSPDEGKYGWRIAD